MGGLPVSDLLVGDNSTAGIDDPFNEDTAIEWRIPVAGDLLSVVLDPLIVYDFLLLAGLPNQSSGRSPLFVTPRRVGFLMLVLGENVELLPKNSCERFNESSWSRTDERSIIL